MLKCVRDSGLSNLLTLDSLEIVAISRKPRKNFLSKNLIALLCYGGVPDKYFKDILTNTLEDARNVFFSAHAALRVALNHGEIDDCFTVAQMIYCGVPLDEPYLQHRLSFLTKAERTALKGGKLPIDESFYLMGTADPTGVLNSDEVCIILDNGQISGKVLVYRNPGLHFGDVHVLNAVYVEELVDIVGNAKYGIFFSTKGQRSAATEIANGDFDGDMYWVSRNPQLLHYFKASTPWKRIQSVPNMPSKKPSELSPDELELELFELFMEARFQHSNDKSVAADSWLAFMDRFLTLGEDSANEKELLKEKMLQLTDIYYDALDAPKSGKKVAVPNELRAERYPHFMGRGNSYHSTSILGQLYDMVDSFQTEEMEIKEIRKLPCFDVEIPENCLSLWSKRYDDYRKEMAEALKSSSRSQISSSEGLKPDKDSKNEAASQVIKKYKQLLYGAAELGQSTRRMEDVYNEALAIYHVSYDYARIQASISKCGFAWRVAGQALCNLHGLNQNERSIFCLPSKLKEHFR